jgi:hypothetical protein
MELFRYIVLVGGKSRVDHLFKEAPWISTPQEILRFDSKDDDGYFYDYNCLWKEAKQPVICLKRLENHKVSSLIPYSCDLRSIDPAYVFV